MSGNRIVYQNWIAEIGRDPFQPVDRCSGEASKVNTGEIYRQVQRALEKLNEDEREFVIRFYYMGESYLEISKKSGRSVYRLASLHKRAIKKLRQSLTKFVADRFKIDSTPNRDCPLCNSPQREEIDELIRTRDKTAPWKPVIACLRKEYGLKINSPQLLIGHEKYH